tara:strand:+ start:30 stop:404 length:375 start_codon:yes stop_codon:yes gene_type:complete
MAKSKVDHSKNISSTTPVRGWGSVVAGDIISFKYQGKDIYDRTPMIMILHKHHKIVHGVNINYLKEFIVRRLLTEKNFKKLKWYSLYTKAFRTYSKSKISSIQKVSYKNPNVNDDSQDILDSLI